MFKRFKPFFLLLCLSDRQLTVCLLPVILSRLPRTSLILQQSLILSQKLLAGFISFRFGLFCFVPLTNACQRSPHRAGRHYLGSMHPERKSHQPEKKISASLYALFAEGVVAPDREYNDNPSQKLNWGLEKRIVEPTTHNIPLSHVTTFFPAQSNNNNKTHPSSSLSNTILAHGCSWW